MATNNVINVPSNTIARSGANSDITSLTGLTGTIQAPTGVKSSAGVDLFTFTYTASAVNNIQVLNNTTGSAPGFAAVGSDTNIELQLTGKGTSGCKITGCSTNSDAVSGQVGEFISSVVLQASPVNVSGGVATNITSVSLTAGDWDVWGNITLITAGTSQVQLLGWVSSSSATLPDGAIYTGFSLTAGASVASSCGVAVLQRRFSLASTTTVYLEAYTASSAGTPTVCGGIYARRVR